MLGISQKHILNNCTSPLDIFEANALMIVCDGEPAPRRSACEQPPVCFPAGLAGSPG